MKRRLKAISLPNQQGEVVVSKDNNRVAIHRAARAGKLQKLAPRVYTTTLQDPPEKIVRANCWTIAGALFPHALISDRTALEQRPAADGSVFLITDRRSTDLKLPGITFRPRRGHPPIEGYDMPFLAGLWMSSQARALMDNLRSTRQRGHVRSTLTREELEEFIEKILRNSGQPVLNKLRDQAREIAPQLGMKAEAEKLSAIIGAMMGTRDEPLSTDLAVSRSKGIGYDPDRMILFEHLRAALASHPFADRLAKERDTYLPFFESYFSNFIEGTEFDISEAYDIVYEGVIPRERPEDAHDVLGTFRIVSDSSEMRRTARNAKEFVELLRYRHSVILAGRPDKNPGQFKSQVNRAGETVFVEPDLVVGTLHRGFELLQTLQHPMARAIYAMFLLAEVHPFSDGNGRIARIMMNAELHRAGYERVMIPNVYRTEYLQALRALTHNQRTAALISVMDYAQRFVSDIDFVDYAEAVKRLDACHAFGKPADAIGAGDKLILRNPQVGSVPPVARFKRRS